MTTFHDMLSLSRESEHSWVGAPGPGIGKRMFGGHALAQAVMAATLDDHDDRHVHSLHAYFMKPGAADQPISYTVTTLAEGRSFGTRRIDAVQGDRQILTMTASSQISEPGLHHAAAMPEVPDVDTAQRTLDSWRAKQEDFDALPIIGRLSSRPIEAVPVDVEGTFGNAARSPSSSCWMRIRQPEGLSEAMQRPAMAYASDMLFLRNALLPHGIRPGEKGIQIASLDHAIWFHKTPDFSQWHLYAGESPWSGAARGLSKGHFFDNKGRLVATVAQENLMRVRDDRLDQTDA
ncbi:acyl-CoA thioesterase [Aurantiacibacter sp. MUD61]|uniref:acyl-CoA thioesterase n=1 Tax=Aurantiacibacter sp. MUD61 TaxID=3009083 RepID=UPI0022F01342|nr:acyl-CoA thioesterase domain-containing protein [Aurantiacibacter sp. MUD61]